MTSVHAKLFKFIFAMANSPYFMKLMQLQLKYIRFQLKITDEIAHGLYKYLEMTGFQRPASPTFSVKIVQI